MNLNRNHNRPSPPTVRTAAIYAGYLAVLIHLLFLVMLFYGRNAVIPYEDHHPPRPELTSGKLLYGVVSIYLYMFLLFCVNFFFLKNERYSYHTRTLIALGVSLCIVFVWNKLTLSLQEAVFDFPRPGARALRGSLVRDTVLGGLAHFTSQILFLSYRRHVMALEHEALKAEYERARYEALESRVDPHFLFNTLNTLNAVIATDPQRAQRYVQKLSSIFRYTIQSRDTTTLAEELAFTKAYCDLMQIRYGENLRFEFDILGKYESCLVVPFSVQTLVENAIKHNVISDRHPLTVTVATDADDCLTVSNPVQPKNEPETGEGIGLANLSERYRLKWGEEVVIRNTGTVFRVRLPLICKPYNLDDESADH